MSYIFLILLLISTVFFWWGIISPKSLSKAGKRDITRKEAGLGFGILSFLCLVLIGVTAPPTPQASHSTDQTVRVSETKKEASPKQQPQKKQPVLSKEAVAENHAIPFTKATVEDPNLTKGATRIVTAGADGVKTLTYEVVYQDGVEQSKTLVSEAVTSQPVTEVTAIGLYVKPAPQPVSRPAPTPATGGASAICRDGTLSYSQNRRGTCSHHGGVAQWL